MLVFLAGIGAVAALVVGWEGLSARGLPISSEQRLTGPWAKVIGVVCLIIGVCLIGFTAYLILNAYRSANEPLW